MEFKKDLQNWFHLSPLKHFICTVYALRTCNAKSQDKVSTRFKFERRRQCSAPLGVITDDGHLFADAVRHFGALLLVLCGTLFVIFALIAMRGVTLGLGLVGALVVVHCPAGLLVLCLQYTTTITTTITITWCQHYRYILGSREMSDIEPL